MSIIKATFFPAPIVVQPSSHVQLTLDSDLANKLRALLGQCNGNFFDQLYLALDNTMQGEGAPNKLKLQYVDPKEGERVRSCIDLVSRYKFITLS